MVVDLASKCLTAILALVPPKPRQVCFISSPDLSDNAWAFFRYLAKHASHEVEWVWLVANIQASRQKLLEMHGTERNVRIARKRTLTGLFLFLRSKYTFHTHGHYHFFRGSKRRTIVNLWHGMPLKTIELLDPIARRTPFYSDYAISTSAFFQKVIAQAFGLPESRVLISGLPRNDVLRVKSPIPRYLALPEHTRVAVWMPTFRRSFFGDVRADSKSDVITSDLLKTVDHLLSNTQTVCILKLHPMDHLNGSLNETFTNIRVLRAADDNGKHDYYEELLAAADCLVTDFSSVFIDFALTRRPIGFYIPDRDRYTRGFIDDVLKNVGFPGARLSNAVEIANFMAGDLSTEILPSSFGCMHANADMEACETLHKSLVQRGHLAEII